MLRVMSAYVPIVQWLMSPGTMTYEACITPTDTTWARPGNLLDHSSGQHVPRKQNIKMLFLEIST